MKDNLTIFINRLKKLNIKLELFGNYPWIYIDKIDGKKVKEKHASDWGFVLGYRNEGFVFEDIGKIFELLRNYKNEK